MTCPSTKVSRQADLECFVKHITALPDHIIDPLHKPSALDSLRGGGGGDVLHWKAREECSIMWVNGLVVNCSKPEAEFET